MNRLLKRFSESALLPGLADRLAAGAHTGVSGVVGAARSMLAADLAQRLGRVTVLVPDDGPTARALHLDLSTLAPDIGLLFFEPDSPRLPIQLAGLKAGPAVIVASAESLHKPAPIWEQEDESREPGTTLGGPLSLSLNQQFALDKLVGWLEENGYERTDLVTEPGEYATRGGIADIFPEGTESPVRVEFLGDSIASLRRFDPLLQRSVSQVESASLPTRKKPSLSDQPASTLLPRDSIIVTEGSEFESHSVLLLSTEPDAEFNLGCTPAHTYVGNIELLRQELGIGGSLPSAPDSPVATWFIAASTDSQRDRLSSIIGPGPQYFTAALSAGFVAQSLGFGLLTEREIYGTPVFHPPRRRFKGLPIDNIVSLRPGDYVVHVDYGIGKFAGTGACPMRRAASAERRGRIDGCERSIEKDYLVVEYAGGTRSMYRSRTSACSTGMSAQTTKPRPLTGWAAGPGCTPKPRPRAQRRVRRGVAGHLRSPGSPRHPIREDNQWQASSRLPSRLRKHRTSSRSCPR